MVMVFDGQHIIIQKRMWAIQKRRYGRFDTYIYI